jgi:hypothetical protein
VAASHPLARETREEGAMRKEMTSLRILIALAGAMVMACEGTTPSPVPSSLSITETYGLHCVSRGQEWGLKAIETLSDGTTKEVSSDATWISSDESVLTVSATGLTTVKEFGRVAVTARYQGISATVPLELLDCGDI